MNMPLVIFSIFSFLLLLSGAMVFLVRNSVYASFYLISSFILASSILILMGAAFLGFIIMIIYIGAVAVFFLFVVMMLDVDRLQKDARVLPGRNYLIPSIAFLAIFIIELGMAVAFWHGPKNKPHLTAQSDLKGLLQIGHELYTTYAYPLQIAAIILFIAMIGAIILTLEPQGSKKRFRQNINRQIRAHKRDILTCVNLQPNQKVVMLYSTELAEKEEMNND